MKGFKRLVSGLLAVLMIATSFNFTVFAAEDEYSRDQALVVSKVSAANVMTGTNNGFEGDKTLTRAEAAAIVVRMKGISDSQVKGSKGETLFEDVNASHWASGYINVATSMNLISGTGKNLFQPEREVSVVEFVAMAIRALGAGTLVNSNGVWPKNYINFAAEEGLLEGVSRVYTASASRMDAAFIAANTLEADMWIKDQVTNTSEITYAKKEGKTLLKEALNITKAEAAVIAEINLKDRNVDFKNTEAKKWGNYDVVKGVELGTLKAGMEVDVWANTKDREIVRIFAAENSKQTTIEFTDIKKIDSKKITLVVDGKEKKYNYTAKGDSDDTEIKYNYDDVDIDDIKDLVDDKKNVFGTVVLDGTNIETLYVESYTNWGVVEEIKNDRIYFDDKIKMAQGDRTIDIDEDEDIEFVVTKDGKEIDVTDIEEGDALFFYTSDDNDKYTIKVINNSVEGEVKSISKDKYIKIDGKKYNAANDKTTGISSGDEIKAYLNENDELVMFETIDGSVDSTVAMVKSLRGITDKYGKESLEIILVKLDGTELDSKVIDLEESAKEFKDNNVTELDEEIEIVRAIYNKVAEEYDYDANINVAGNDVNFKGQVVRYSLKSGEVVLREIVGTFNNAKTSYDEEKIAPFKNLTYTEKNGRLKDGNNVKYRLDSNTVVFVEKAYKSTESKSKYSTRFEEIDFEDLGNSSNLEGFVIGIDDDTETIDAVVFRDKDGNKVSRAKAENYAVVLDKSTISTDDDDDNDKEYELLLANGDEETVVSDIDLEIGDVIEAFITDGVLTDADKINDTKEGYVCGIYGNIISVIFEDGIKRESEDLAENVMIVEIQEDGDYKNVSKKGNDIQEVGSDINTAAGAINDGATKVTFVYAYNSETESNEIVAMFYNED